MNKGSNVLKNIGILSIGQFSTKILVFLLIPLYTNVLTTDEYGAYDLVYTTISLMLPIVTLNISVSSQRFLLESNPDKKGVYRISLKYTLLGIVIALICLVVNHFFLISDVISENSAYCFLLFIAIALNSILTELAIGSEKLKAVAVSGVLSTFVNIALNLYLLLVLKLGLSGYFLASIIGQLFQIIYFVFALRIRKTILGKEIFRPDTESRMLAYSKPQIVNNIGWWVNNASDRYVVTWFCGVGVNGIYSVAYKIPAIINMLGGIFSQATGITVVKHFDAEDKDGFFSSTYEFYNVFMVICCSIIICLDKIIASFMFAKDFYVAWQFVPFLVMASMFGAVSGYLGGVFSAQYAAKEFSKSMIVGAAVNVVVNFILTPFMGAIGAAFATLISYFVIWLMRFIFVKRTMLFQIQIKKDILAYTLLLTQSLVMSSGYFTEGCLYITEVTLSILIVTIYRKTVICLVKKVLRKI